MVVTQSLLWYFEVWQGYYRGYDCNFDFASPISEHLPLFQQISVLYVAILFVFIVWKKLQGTVHPMS